MFTCKIAKKIATQMAEDNPSLDYTKDFGLNGDIIDKVALVHELGRHVVALERSGARAGRVAEIRNTKSLIYFIEKSKHLYYDWRSKSYHAPWSSGYKKLSIYASPAPPSLT